MANYTKYKAIEQALPEDRYDPSYVNWAEDNGYLKRNLAEACQKIADLVVENRKLKATIATGLPVGALNKLRD